MADAADAPEPSHAPAATTASQPSGLTLHVVSPSMGVSSDLSFSNLPETMTVKELKARIRNALPSKPTDESQRLIYRGRMLSRESETFLQILGQETLARHEPQTIHLVLRPTAQDGLPPPTMSNPTPHAPAASAGLPTPPQVQFRSQSIPVNPLLAAMHAQQTQQAVPGFQHPMQPQGAAESIQGAMVQRLGVLQRDALRLQQEMQLIEQRIRSQPVQANFNTQHSLGPGIPPQSIFQRPVGPSAQLPSAPYSLLHQQQRERAADGRHGVQDTGYLGGPPGHFPQPASGRASPSIYRPDSTTTYTREGIGPNGERWSVSVNETTSPMAFQQAHHHHHPASHSNPILDIQAVLRNADRRLAQNEQNNIRRSASNPTLNQTATGPGPASERTGAVAAPATTSNSPLASAIPSPPRSTLHVPPQATAAVPVSSTPASISPTVYLVSSPSGPRALLVTNNETYFTPRQSSRRRPSPTAQVQGQAQAPGGPAVLPEYRNRAAQRARPRRPAAPAVANQLHANPGAGALGAQAGPLLWLVFRLACFVWFFTSGNPSWTRWLMVSTLGLVVFLINTGLLNGLFNELLGPLRRHLENLIPLAGPEAALVPAVNAAIPPPAREPEAGGLTEPRRQRGEPDPAEVAARIIEQRRQARGGWFMAQVRRAEHSFLLFLASLVPGVGERHIAAREAEAVAAEARRVAAAEAAATAANSDAAGAGAGAGAEGGVNGTEGTSSRTEDAANGAQNEEPAAPPAQPLIDV